MLNYRFSFAAFAAITLLSACGGGGGDATAGIQDSASLQQYASQFATFNSDPTLASPAPNATVDTQSGTTTYLGVVNIGTDAASNPAGQTSYYGSLSMTVDFTNAGTNDAVRGTAENFVQFFSEIASPKTNQAVGGSIAMSGNLTGNNTGRLGDGMTGTAAGSIDGIDVAYTFDGNITGVNANGISVNFDGTNANSTGGVGFGTN